MQPLRMNIEDYTYELPEHRIAKYPLQNREEAKLLVYENEKIGITKFSEIAKQLNAGSLMVVNNTKVVHARLYFYKKTGAKIEIFCLEPQTPPDYEQIFGTQKKCVWKCLVGNAKKWKNEILVSEYGINDHKIQLFARKVKNMDGTFLIEFNWNEGISFSQLLSAIGEIPIPPYLKRKSESIDKQRYQTVYSQNEGSVAAPTAGLHFSEQLFKTLTKKHIEKAALTLHVGAGTFQPVIHNKIDKHIMHRENFNFTKAFVEKIILNLGKIVAVGTTSVRSLESIYQIGVKIIHKQENPFWIQQWEAYKQKDISAEKALKALLNYMTENKLESVNANTQIIIVPGYRFKMINTMITNFHLPRSTLLLLIAAWVGDDWKKIYNTALQQDFRFLSYGDCSLLHKKIR